MNDKIVGIIGAGISGLHTAYELAKKGKPFILFDARERVGGRINSPAASSNLARFDIGPSWFWPSPTHIEKLVAELGVDKQVFQQYASGDALYEPLGHGIQRGIAGISMAGSNRIDGGLRVITEALREKIIGLAGNGSIKLNTAIESISLSEASVNVKAVNENYWQCDKVVLALPPRVALELISFSPQLTPKRQEALNKVTTWMAGHAKAMILYKRPFWRNNGLSGDIISQLGPLSEIHDASPFDADKIGCYALFGFFAKPPAHRAEDKAIIDAQIIEQLTRLLGSEASSPTEIIYKDWAKDKFTSSQLDQNIPNHHPSNYWDSRVEENWHERLIWSGSESCEGHYNGYIEGAVIASEATLNLL